MTIIIVTTVRLTTIKSVSWILAWREPLSASSILLSSANKAHKSHVLILNLKGILGFSLIRSLPPLTNWSKFAAVICSPDTTARFEFSFHYKNYQVAAVPLGWVHGHVETKTSCCESASASPEKHSSSPCTFSFHMPSPAWVRNFPSTTDPASQYTKHSWSFHDFLTPSISYLS